VKKLIEIAKKLLVVVIAGAVLWVLYVYVEPIYHNWHPRELWLSEYASISLKVVWIAGAELAISFSALLLAFKAKGA